MRPEWFDGIEVAWGPEPVDAALVWQPHRMLGDLAFIDPKTGQVVTIAVTPGAQYSTEAEHVWHIEIAGDIATVSQSVHFVGHFHSGNPAHFRLIP
jgi:hypothetical protein